MALNSSGPISLAGTTAGQSIEIENGGNGTTQISLNDTAVRNLAGVTTPGSTITMPTNFYGKSNVVNISYTFSANTTNASLNLSSISGYSAGNSNITVTINSGVYLYATSTSSYGLNLSGGTTGDTLTIVNNGYIIGCGGDGLSTIGSVANGGPALNLGFGMSACTINNTNASAYIAGGGGGGTNGQVAGYTACAGGGAGGGRAYNVTLGTYIPGGGPGQAGNSASGVQNTNVTGQPGGRILPGTGGYVTYTGYPIVKTEYSAGAGGFSCNNDSNGGIYYGSATAGGGGSGSSNAPNGQTFTGKGAGGSGGGGWGATGGYNPNYAKWGGSGGKAVNTNGKTVTWTSGNTTRVYGSVS